MPRLVLPSEHKANWQKIRAREQGLKLGALKLKDAQAQQDAMAAQGGGTLAGWHKKQLQDAFVAKSMDMIKNTFDTAEKIGFQTGSVDTANSIIQGTLGKTDPNTPFGKLVKKVFPELPEYTDFAADGVRTFRVKLDEDRDGFKAGDYVSITEDKRGNEVSVSPAEASKLTTLSYGQRQADPEGNIVTEALHKPIAPAKADSGKDVVIADDESSTGYSYINTVTGKKILNASPSTAGIAELRKSKVAAAEQGVKSSIFKNKIEKTKAVREFANTFMKDDGTPITVAEARKAISALETGGELPKDFVSMKASKNLMGQKIVTQPTPKDIQAEAKSLTNLYQIKTPQGVRDMTASEARAEAKSAYANEPPRDDLVMRSTIKDVKVRNASTVKLVSSFKQQIGDLGVIRKLYDDNKEEYVGYAPSIEGWIRRKAHIGVEGGFEKFRANVTTFFTTFLKSLSGSQVTKYEEQRIKQVIPNVSDDPTLFKAKLDTLDSILKRHLNANIDALAAAGYPEMGAVREGVAPKATAVEDVQVDRNEAQAVWDRLKSEKGRNPTEEEFLKAVQGK
jgi:hypothetical protein